jgi:hypothetical protein
MATPIDQLIKDTQSLEPGDFQAGDYIREPVAEAANKPEVGGMVVSDLESAGYTILYDTITREPSYVNNNMLLPQLKVVRDDGSFVFTRAKPSKGPWRGTIKCFLHPGQPDRSRYDEMGFPSCNKASLPNKYQAENHARNRHRDEWRAVEAERETLEREEERQLQRDMTSALVETATTGPSDGQCGECGWHSSANRRRARRASLARHLSTAHPDSDD